MKTYKQLISELSLTTLTRYRHAARKSIPALRDASKKTSYIDANILDKAFNREDGVRLATKKINRKMAVQKLAKPLEK